MKPAVYTEQEARRWLGWLARGMQKHGQSIFQVEQLQPDWLLTPRQIWCYLAASRVAQSCVLVLLAVLFSIAFAPDDLDPAKYVAIMILSVGLSSALGEGFLKSGRRDAGAVTAYVLWMICANLAVDYSLGSLEIAPILLTIRGIRGLDGEIQPTESLAWSWKGFGKGFIFRKILFRRRTAGTNTSDVRAAAAQTLSERLRHFGSGAFVGWSARIGVLLYFAAVADAAINAAMATIGKFSEGDYFWPGPIWHALGQYPLSSMDALDEARIWLALFVALLPSLLGGIFTAISRREIEMKTVPNEGIRRSVRTALAFSAPGFIVAAAIMRFSTGGVWSEDLRTGIQTLLVAPGIYLGAWFGGMDALAHYVLRIVLRWNGYAPLNYPRFLDYAATKLGFLQKAGGGYIFMHRYLLEYFASGDGEPVETEIRSSAAAAQ